MTTKKRTPPLNQQPEIWEKDLYQVWDYAMQIRERDGRAAAEALTQRILATLATETKTSRYKDDTR